MSGMIVDFMACAFYANSDTHPENVLVLYEVELWEAEMHESVHSRWMFQVTKCKTTTIMRFTSGLMTKADALENLRKGMIRHGVYDRFLKTFEWQSGKLQTEGWSATKMVGVSG